ncbi:MAG: hypothetical protein LBD78_05855 [Spirochaetaceae bacterium]|nr:hypothetical protein [Spirochaetaceae bacterium]
MKDGRAEDIVKAGGQCIADAEDGGGFVLMPGCDIPAATPFANVKPMTETAALHRFARS